MSIRFNPRLRHLVHDIWTTLSSRSTSKPFLARTPSSSPAPTKRTSKMDVSKWADMLTVSPAALLWLIAWYMCSLVTLFMNKIILSSEGGDKYILGASQMTMTALLGAAKVYGPGMLRARSSGTLSPNKSSSGGRHATFWRDMLFVGVMRGLTVIFGLVSLAHVAVSFTETVKSSAPFFTVIFAFIMLGERTSLQVNLSLIPVMLGLALASANELSFDMIGFMAAVMNNVIDCIQNVFSKKLLSSLSPVELQFYTSAMAAVLQLPIMFYLIASRPTSTLPDTNLATMILIDSVFYHLQSVTAYFTMSYLSPVSQSVANTAKRALLIFLSILWFGNPITPLCAVGMLSVILGVFLYNWARRNFPAYVPPPQKTVQV